MLHEFWENFRHNLFKPLLLFFYMGLLVPILGVKLDFPHVIYQGLTIYHSIAIHNKFDIGTYVLFSVLCGAASYIAVPAVQRLAIPEASPTLPVAASLGLTFSYNVTIGIPVYIQIAKTITEKFPVT
jgi:hypothetical protein